MWRLVGSDPTRALAGCLLVLAAFMFIWVAGRLAGW
jgi:hypothetical protein